MNSVIALSFPILFLWNDLGHYILVDSLVNSWKLNFCNTQYKYTGNWFTFILWQFLIFQQPYNIFLLKLFQFSFYVSLSDLFLLTLFLLSGRSIGSFFLPLILLPLFRKLYVLFIILREVLLKYYVLISHLWYCEITKKA